MTATPDPCAPTSAVLSPDHLFSAHLRIVVTVGVATGLVVVGVGSRLAMLLLRVTSGDRVVGLTSDDGFTIGRFTLRDTYGLVQIGAVVGPIGAATYLLLRPRLLGPGWFRHLTVALAAGAVGGAMLLHADGVDFSVLAPRWLAIALFIAIPAVFGGTVAIVVDLVERRGPPSWRAVILALLCGPGALVSSVVVVPAAFYVAVRDLRSASRPPIVAVGVAARAFWLSVAAVGLVAVVADVRSILELPQPR